MSSFIDVHLHLQMRAADRDRAFAEVGRLQRLGAKLLVFYREEVDPACINLYEHLLEQTPAANARAYGVGAGTFESQVDNWNQLQGTFHHPSLLAVFLQRF